MITKKEKEEIEAKYNNDKTPYDEEYKDVIYQLSYCRVQLKEWRETYFYFERKQVNSEIEHARHLMHYCEDKIKMLERNKIELSKKILIYKNENKKKG